MLSCKDEVATTTIRKLLMCKRKFTLGAKFTTIWSNGIMLLNQWDGRTIVSLL